MATTIDFSRLKELTNKWIQDIWNCRERYILNKGGGGSGKSYGICQLLVYRLIAEQGHKLLVIRKVDNTLRESCFSLFKEVISSYGLESLFTINKSEMKIICVNGNEVIFKGLQDPERIKSINGITLLWIEEATELEQADLQQLDIRLRSKSKYPLQMFITFNPVSATHWIKAKFFDNPPVNTKIIETTYKDNRFLPQVAIDVLEAFKETDPYYYQVYALGQWGVLGKTIFNPEQVSERISRLKEIYKEKDVIRGIFKYELISVLKDEIPHININTSSIEFEEDFSGSIYVYEEVRKGIPYCIGVDTAGEGSDYFVAHVIDNTSGKQVCCYKIQNIDEDKFAEQVYCLGKYYNNALIAVEINFSTYPQKHLEKLGYPKLYIREQLDVIGEKTSDKFGFKTTSLTRPAIISNLVKIIREDINLINDIQTLEEMLTFVRNEKGKPVAENGVHDDHILSLAITYFCRTQQEFCYIPILDNTNNKKIPDFFVQDESYEDENIW